MTFEYANFSFALYYDCNYNCSYCTQLTDKKDTKKLNINIFKQIVKKIFLELNKNKIKRIEFSLMGGEISTDKESIEFLKILILESNKNTIDTQINLITNFSGPVEYFKDSVNLFKDSKSKFKIIITLHHEYINKRIFKKINALPKELLEFKLLRNEEYQDNLNISNIEYFESIFKEYNFDYEIQEIRFDGGGISKELPPRKCNALYYKIEPDGKIIDNCRHHSFNFLNFKLIPEIINCNINCLCPFLLKEFQMIDSEKGVLL